MASSISKQITIIHRRLYELGFSVGNDGNTSQRVDAKTAWITPAGLNKAKLKPDQICKIEIATGKILHGKKPSTEWHLHAEIYKANPNIQSIVHAHPPFSIACSLSGISLEQTILPELTIAIGYIPTLPYMCPGTMKIAVQAAQAIRNRKAILLSRHGVVAVGETLEEALIRIEAVEFGSKILLLAHTAGKVTPLSPSETEELNRQIETVYRTVKKSLNP